MVSAYYLAWVAALLRYQLFDPAHSPTIFWLGLAILRSRLCRLAAACELSDRSHLNPGRFQFHVSGTVTGEHPAAVPLSRQFLRRNRFASSVAVPGTPVAARLRLSTVVFATRMAFLPVRHQRVVAHRTVASSPAPEPLRKGGHRTQSA